MARARTAKHPRPETKPVFTETASVYSSDYEAAKAANDKAMSKADMVRQAMSAGMEKPEAGVAYVKEHFGVELAKPMWSSYRAQIRAREAKASGETRGAVPHSAIPVNFGADIRAIKGLIESAGSGEQLKELAGTIGSLVQKYGVSGLSDLIDAFE